MDLGLAVNFVFDILFGAYPDDNLIAFCGSVTAYLDIILLLKNVPAPSFPVAVLGLFCCTGV